MKKIFNILLVCFAVVLLTSCSSGKESTGEEKKKYLDIAMKTIKEPKAISYEYYEDYDIKDSINSFAQVNIDKNKNSSMIVEISSDKSHKMDFIKFNEEYFYKDVNAEYYTNSKDSPYVLHAFSLFREAGINKLYLSDAAQKQFLESAKLEKDGDTVVLSNKEEKQGNKKNESYEVKFRFKDDKLVGEEAIIFDEKGNKTHSKEIKNVKPYNDEIKKPTNLTDDPKLAGDE